MPTSNTPWGFDGRPERRNLASRGANGSKREVNVSNEMRKALIQFNPQPDKAIDLDIAEGSDHTKI